MPVFGKGDPVEVDEDSDEEHWEFQSKSKEKPEKKPEPAFQFGFINIVLIFGIGAIFCFKLGLFEGDNVPDFVAKRDDLEYYFKSLAPPEPVNDTDDGTGKKKKPEADPFAAPKEEKNV